MNKKEYLKRMGNIYALAIQKGLTYEEIIQYSERAFSFLYLNEDSKQKGRCLNDTRTDNKARVV